MNVRLSPEEKILFQQAATLASLSLSEWVRKVLIAAAQPVRPSEPGEGVLRMEKGKYVPLLPYPQLNKLEIPECLDPVPVITAIVSAPPVTAPPPPPVPEPLPEPVVTQAKMSMVERMYASIEARQGKPAADFWLMTNKKKI